MCCVSAQLKEVGNDKVGNDKVGNDALLHVSQRCGKAWGPQWGNRMWGPPAPTPSISK